jgi:hypothetical protein
VYDKLFWSFMDGGCDQKCLVNIISCSRATANADANRIILEEMTLSQA